MFINRSFHLNNLFWGFLHLSSVFRWYLNFRGTAVESCRLNTMWSMQFLKQIFIVACVGTKNRCVLISTRSIYLHEHDVFLAAACTRREASRFNTINNIRFMCSRGQKNYNHNIYIYRYLPTVIKVFTVHSTRFASQAVLFFFTVTTTSSGKS